MCMHGIFSTSILSGAFVVPFSITRILVIHTCTRPNSYDIHKAQHPKDSSTEEKLTAMEHRFATSEKDDDKFTCLYR